MIVTIGLLALIWVDLMDVVCKLSMVWCWEALKWKENQTARWFTSALRCTEKKSKMFECLICTKEMLRNERITWACMYKNSFMTMTTWKYFWYYLIWFWTSWLAIHLNTTWWTWSTCVRKIWGRWWLKWYSGKNKKSVYGSPTYSNFNPQTINVSPV